MQLPPSFLPGFCAATVTARAQDSINKWTREQVPRWGIGHLVSE